MSLEKFDEIIKFAIERENEAAEFYRYMQDIVKFKSQKDLLKEYERMEESHARALETIKESKISEMEIGHVENLMISDYVVDKKPSPEMTYQDIIIIAMKREEAAHRLYTNLAKEVGEPRIKKLFEKLAEEELKHKLHFEKIYDDEFFEEN
ncbi:MAG: ferritin family protein [Acidobacteriota bacterium]